MTRRLVVAVLAALGILSVLGPAWRWLAADGVVEERPERAQALVPGHPRALELMAARALAEGDTNSAEELAKAAIARRPLEGRPYRILAALYEQSGRLPEARAAHRAAIAVAPNESISRLWTASWLLSEGKYPEALGHVDRALRARPDLAATIFPVLLQGLGNPDFVRALIEALGRDPPWRPAFVADAFRRHETIDSVLPLIEGLSARGALPEGEARLLVERLEREWRWAELRSAWQRFVEGPPNALLVDGGFERDPHGFGLGWQVSRVPGATVAFSLARGSRDGGRALTVRFLDQRVPFAHVRQRLLLQPGSYRLSGEARAEALRARHGLAWDVVCDGRDDVLARSPLIHGTRPWQAWAVDFEIPVDCPSQWLTLRLVAIGPSEQLVGGAAAFDGLSITRQPDVRAPSPADEDAAMRPARERSPSGSLRAG